MGVDKPAGHRRRRVRGRSGTEGHVLRQGYAAHEVKRALDRQAGRSNTIDRRLGSSSHRTNAALELFPYLA